MTDNQSLGLGMAMNDLPLWSAQVGLKLLDIVKFKPNAKVLDIGCGLGFPSLELAMRFGKSATIYGIDPWLQGLEYTKQKAELLKLENTRFLKQYAENLSFDNAFFDCVVSNNGLNNVQNLEIALLESARVAKPNSQLAFAIYTQNYSKEFYTVFEQVLAFFGLNESIVKMNEHLHNHKKSIIEIENQLKRSGFKLVSKIEEVFYLRYLDGTSLLNHHWIREVFYPVWMGFVAELHQKQVFELLETKLNQLAESNTEIKLTVPFVVFDCIKAQT